MADEYELEDHQKVLVAALQVYAQRDEIHKGLWKNDSAQELSFQALHKAKRLDHHCRAENPDVVQATDEALDLINYAVFVIRQLGDPRG